MKLLTSLCFTAFCMLSTTTASEPLLATAADKSTQVNASEIFPKNLTTAISISTTTVENPRDDVFQAYKDLSRLKFCSAVCAVMWVNLLIKCYSECNQTKCQDDGTGLLTAYTFHLALKYFKLSWFPEKLTPLNLMPHAVLVALTVLSMG